MTQTAHQGAFAPFDAKDWKIGIITAQFNQDITGKLQQSVIDRARDYNIGDDQIDIFETAGAVEIPLLLQHLARSGKYQALLAVGCVIKGETAHFEYVCTFVTEGVLRVQLDEQMPIAFGVLMCDTHAQAEARAGLGAEHLDAVLHQAKLLA